MDEKSIPEEGSPKSRDRAEEAKRDFLSYLADGKLDIAMNIAADWNLPDEVLHSDEVRRIAKEEMIRCFSWDAPDIAVAYAKQLQIPAETVDEALELALIDAASEGRLDSLDTLVRGYPVPDRILHSARVLAAVREGSRRLVNEEHYSPQNVKERYEDIFGPMTAPGS